MKDGRFLLSQLYLLLHTVLCSALLYLLVQSLAQADSGMAILLFVGANLLFILLISKLSLRAAWAICAFLLLYLLLQSLADFSASRLLSSQAIATLYNILQARMALVLASLFLLSSVLVLRFGKYRSAEAVALLLLAFILLTREELSLAFENRYGLYRALWLGLPSLSLLLLVLALHPYLRREASWLPASLAKQSKTSLGAGLKQRGQQVASFAALLLLLFALLWWAQISPVDWNQTTRGTGNGLLEKNLNNQFDFSDYLHLDSSLEQDRQLIMMSQIENLRDDRPAYLTRFTLGGLAARRNFFRDPQEPNMPGESPLPLELEQGTSLFQMPRYDLRQKQEMDVYLLNIPPSSLFVLNYPSKVQTFENWPDSSFSRVFRVEARTLVEPFLFGPPLEAYPALLSEEHLAYYTQLPEEYNDIATFTVELLKELQPQLENLDSLQPLATAQLITDYFHREYRYTLNPGIAPDGDQLRHFLFDSKKGYCTYFAFSSALMLRSLGIPTRIAVGFLLNPELRILDYYPLFADQAHAWVEVFEPQQGWVTFDPTTFELAPGETLEFGLPEGADLVALTEELLRNHSLQAEDGLRELGPEKSPVQLLLARLLQSLRQTRRLLPFLLPLLFLALLLGYRLRLWYLALRSGLSDQDRVLRAMYHYLQLLQVNLFAKKLPPRRLHAWQDTLQNLGRSETLHNGHSCLRLFQKYYFSADFGAKDLLELRRQLRAAKVPASTWNPLYLMHSFLRFCARRNWS